MKVNPVARFTFWFLFLTLVSIPVFAVELGKVTTMGISACLTKEDALAILEVEKKSGEEEAGKAFDENPNCSNLMITFKPKQLVTTVKTGRGIAKVVLFVSGGAEGYWITYKNITGLSIT